MLNLITLDKEMIVNGVAYKNAQEALSALSSHSGSVEILINSKSALSVPSASVKAPEAAPKKEAELKDIYRLEVRQYMTEKSSPDFDFMKKYNNDVPMPGRRMYGEILEQTKGMYRMKLHMRAERNSTHCSHCMRELTNPISKAYGIGPICGGHGYFANDYTKSKIKDEEELFKLADAELRKVEWTGWIVKRAIQSWSLFEQVKVSKGA